MEAPNWWNRRAPLEWLQRWWRQRRDGCIVTIQYPKTRIEGCYLRNQTDHIPFISFRGIPYALPPIGPLRFQPPQPLPENEDYEDLEARADKGPCLHFDHKGVGVGSENCLYLNVAIPTMPRSNPGLLPVMVHIQGDSFSKGNCVISEPGTLVGRNLAVVDVSYRSGIFGFLNMDTENCRGNAGLKDIVMALKWVKENIINFGGNPENVTISGHGAGGSYVNLLMISPMSQGLFHKAIVQAGGIHCPWSFRRHTDSKHKLFAKCKSKGEEPHTVVEVLKGEDGVSLLIMGRRLERENTKMEPKRISVSLRPSVERIKEGAFLPQDVEEMMKNAKPVPTIAGITSREGYLYFRANPGVDLVNLVRIKREFADFLKQNFRWSNVVKGILSERVRGRYFPHLERMDDNALLQNLSIFITDLYHRRFYENFRFGIPRHFQTSPLYVYLFDYFTGVPIDVPEERIIGGTKTTIEREAAEHGDDMKFVMGQSWILKSIEDELHEFLKINARIQAVRVIRIMSELWSSFCHKSFRKTELAENDRKIESSLEDAHWIHHSEVVPRYLHITDKLRMVKGLLCEQRWAALNAICREAKNLQALEVMKRERRKDLESQS